jgi:hypothetical protein
LVFQGLGPAGLVKVVPPVEGCSGNPELLQRAPHRTMELLYQADDLGLALLPNPI